MTTIIKSVDLNYPGTKFAWNRDGMEPCAAKAYNVVVYTFNFKIAAYSTDGGTTFDPLNAEGICNTFGESLCCDQVVIYIPRINHFAWVLQTETGNYILALATPQEIEASKGKKWWLYHLRADRYNDKKYTLDLPEIAVGDNFLYLTFNLVEEVVNDETGETNSYMKYSICERISLAEIYGRRTIYTHYIATNKDLELPLVRPVQSTGETGYFVATKSNSELRVFCWPESTTRYTYFDVAISTIPTEDFAVKIPADANATEDWLGPNSKVSSRVYGATRSQSKLWVAWSGARKVSGQTTNTFNYPHIGLAIINIETKKLDNQQYIWNPEFAFAYPSLATNIDGDVGLSYCSGGNTKYPGYAVAMLTGPGRSFKRVTSGKSYGAGGHYVSIREAYPDVSAFCAAGFNTINEPESTNHDRYVLFKT